MPGALPWPALAALASGGMSLYFIRYLWPYRDDPGARFFIGTIACEALWALSYGAALFVFDPALRALFEVPIWLGINFIGVFFLAFALEYTGRGHLVRSRLMGALVLLQVGHTLIVATNPVHGIAWSGYHVEPVFGAATVAYTHQPWLFVNFTGVYLMVAAGAFLLFDTFFSYGPLYRAQAAAIALSPVLPGLAFVLWLFEVGGASALNLTPLTFPVHLGFDMYAFFRRNMFELTPAARRAGDRAAIEDLGSAVVIVDDERRIINANGEARRLFGADEATLLGRPLDEFLDGVDLPAVEGPVSITAAGERREYAVTTSTLEDSVGNDVGYTIVFQDVTTEIRREQRLAVLNRVLRHNLRNDLNVVQGTLEIVDERATDGDLRGMVATANARTEALMDLGEKAREFERAMEADGATSGAVPVRERLVAIRDDLLADRPGRVGIDVPADLRLAADPRPLGLVFENLLENAIEHGDADEPRVEVELVGTAGDGRSAVFEIRDDGAGIPDHERAVIERGEETALEHGSGLGLWLVTWGVDALGGEVRFATDETGTTVTLRLPTAGGSEAIEGAGEAEPAGTTSDEPGRAE